MPPPSAPTIGKTVNLPPVDGLVLVKLPGSAARVSTNQARGGGKLSKGKGFVPLTQVRQLPIGSQIDSRRGTLRIVSATSAKHHPQQVRIGGAIVALSQPRSGFTKGLTTMRLVNNAFPGAPTWPVAPRPSRPRMLGARRQSLQPRPADPPRHRQPRLVPHPRPIRAEPCAARSGTPPSAATARCSSSTAEPSTSTTSGGGRSSRSAPATSVVGPVADPLAAEPVVLDEVDHRGLVGRRVIDRVDLRVRRDDQQRQPRAVAAASLYPARTGALVPHWPTPVRPSAGVCESLTIGGITWS
jgi:hypothetical protein